MLNLGHDRVRIYPLASNLRSRRPATYRGQKRYLIPCMQRGVRTRIFLIDGYRHRRKNAVLGGNKSLVMLHDVGGNSTFGKVEGLSAAGNNVLQHPKE